MKMKVMIYVVIIDLIDNLRQILMENHLSLTPMPFSLMTWRLCYFRVLFVLANFKYMVCTYFRMQRKKGQFTSSKASSDDGGPASSTQASGQDESMRETSWVSFIILIFLIMFLVQ